jgi:putative hydrolase of the HAD superfamily
VKPPRVIFFDAAGTLIRLPLGVGHHYREVAARHGCDLAAGALGTAFRSAWKAMPPRATTREPRPDDDRGWWRALVDTVLDSLDAPPLDREAFFAELYQEFTGPGVWTFYPEVEEVLATLATRAELSVISNFDGRLRTIFTELGIAHHFRHLVISSEVGADKPDPYIFERALALTGCPAGEALHIGDDPRCDWAGAEAAGLQVFRLERPHNDLRALLAMSSPTAVGHPVAALRPTEVGDYFSATLFSPPARSRSP